MPIYDYTCSNCGQTTEVIHGIHADGPRFCPSCGAEGTMRKAFATPAVHFKGSGWAKKDRSSSSGTKAKSATTASSGEHGDGAAKASSGSDADSGSGTAGSTSKPGPSTPSEG